MKYLLIMLLGLCAVIKANAQQAEEVPAYSKEKKAMAWYKDQINAWRKTIDEHPVDANAWYNYYKANRIVLFHDESEKLTGKVKFERLNSLVDEMGKAIPNSYEYNYCKWQAGDNNMDRYEYLKKAIEISPNRTDHIDYMINIGEMKRDIKQRDEYSLKKMKAGLVSTGMIYYNYNQLMGLEQNAILLTAGDHDTYPSWILQAQGIRKDVRVINLYLLHVDDYREKLFNELGLENVQIKDQNNPKEFRRMIVDYLSKNKKSYPVYVAVTSTSCEDYIAEIENNLYLIGTSYKYDTTSFDNIALLKRNMEKLFALDYIDKPFYNEISADWVEQINLNYAIPMLKLYTHYKESGDIQKQEWMREKLKLICKGTEMEKDIMKEIQED